MAAKGQLSICLPNTSTGPLRLFAQAYVESRHVFPEPRKSVPLARRPEVVLCTSKAMS